MNSAARTFGRLSVPAIALAFAGCASKEVPTLTPLITGASPVQQAAPMVSGKIDASKLDASGQYLPVREYSAQDPGVAAAIALASTPGIASIPGVPSAWYDIRDYSFDRRPDFESRVDASISLASGALGNANLSMSKPGMEAEHAEAVRALQQAMEALNQQRSAMDSADKYNWDRNKDAFQAAWQNTESAYARAKATSN